MKKAFLAIAAVALLFATSCTKENNAPENPTLGDGEFLATIDEGAYPQNAPVVNDGMSPKTTIDANRYVIWEAGDEIKINGSIYTTSTTGNTVVFAPSDPKETHKVGQTFHAFFPASIAGTDNAGTLPATQTIVDGKVSNLPMYATSTDNQLVFHNICAVVKITIPSLLDGATRIELSSDQRMNGAFTVDANYKAVMSTAAQDSADKMVTIAKTSGTFTTDEVVYIAVPAQAYGNFKVEFFDGQTSMWNKTVSTCTLDVNKINNISITEMPDTNLLPGVFSVSPTKKVRFTKGNLKGTTGNYYFALSQTESGDNCPFADLFNLGSIDGRNGYSVLDTSEVTYLLGYYQYNQYNSSTAGNHRPCPSGSCRTMTNGAPRMTYPVTIDGTYGNIVIYPDDYSNTNPPSSYTADEWATAEQAGCVCIPSTYKDTRSEYLVGWAYIDDYGFGYWASTGGTDNACVFRGSTYYQNNTTNIKMVWWDLYMIATSGNNKIRLVKECTDN